MRVDGLHRLILVLFLWGVFPDSIGLKEIHAEEVGRPDEDEEGFEVFEELDEAREELGDYLKELKEEIRDARLEGDRDWQRTAEKQRRFVEGLLNRLKEIDGLRKELEEGADAVRAGELEENLESRIEQFERVRHVGELEGALEELRWLKRGVDEDGKDADRMRIARLLTEQNKLINLVRDFHRAIDRDDEGRVEELEEKLERIEEPLALRIQEFHLEWALRWARIEGEDTDELEEELRNLRRELRQIEREPPGGEENEELKLRPKKSAAAVPLTQSLPSSQLAGMNFQSDVVPLLRKYCVDCHGNDASKADLNLEQAIASQPLAKNRELWRKLIGHTRMGVMPPETEPQPSRLERSQLVGWLDHALEHFDYESVRHPGHVPPRRLSHQEYNHTVRDLFGLNLRPADKFPDEATGESGFDNSANTLFVQPLLLERYFSAAEEVVNAAIQGGEIRSPTLRKLFGLSPPSRIDSDGLNRFVTRAFRRPAKGGEVEKYAKHFRALVDSGSSPESAFRKTIVAMLVSPKFLMRTESVPPADSDQPVNDWELASRLSYFLWASMPDERLITLASRGELQDADVLAREIRRMLADPKADSLGRLFAAQWLGYEHLGTRIRLDPIDNPWCTDTLMEAMRSETSRFFVTLVRENAPLRQLIEADYTYLNEELARHYGIDGIKGAHLRRVSLETRRRGGLFGHGSVLAVTSFPGRTSPVVRGKWILADVLGTPPPPPPPNVGEFDERIGENERLSLSQKMELHRRKANCAACHDQIDPLGLSLENFDKFGRWRTRYRGRRIDATGRLPNGTRFAGLAGLKKVIVEQRLDDLARQVSSKMLSYALGRQLDYYDEAALRSIVARFKQDDYRLGTLVREIANSYPFRFKRLPNSTVR